MVYRLAQVQLQILRRTAAMAVHCRRGNRVAHHRDTDCGAQPVTGRDDRILSGECHPAARASGRQINVGQ